MYSPKEPEEEVDHLFFDSECDERDTKKEKRIHQEEDRDSTYNKLVSQTENFQVEECALEMLQKEMSKLEVQNRLIAKDSSECKKDIKMRKESSHQEREKKKTKKREHPPKRKGSVKEAKVASGKVYSNTSSRNSSPFPHSDVSESSQSDNLSSSCSSSSEAEEDDVFKNADDSDHCSEPAKKSTGKFHIWGRSRSSSSSRERSPTPLAKFFNTQSSSPLWRQPQPGSANQKQRPQTSEMADSNDTVTDVTPLSSPDVRRQQLFDLVPPADPLKSVGQQLEANTDGEERSAMLSSGRQLDRMLLVSSPGSTFVSRSSANQHRKNYSFDTSEMRCIERENQRLFRELSRSSTQSSSRFTFRSSAPPLRLYHSGLNRQRQQRRIQQENLAFLKRLESVKPTPGMTRLEQLTDYQRQARYLGIPTLPIRHTSGRNSITCSSANPHRTRPEIAKPTRITAPRPAWS